VVQVFDDMLPRSIPDYHQMRAIVGDVLVDAMRGRKYPTVLDVGASLGGALRDVAPRIDGIRVLGVDNSAAMVDAAQGTDATISAR
jgi:tRNA (cmo5U34)-methyltransferase